MLEENKATEVLKPLSRFFISIRTNNFPFLFFSDKYDLFFPSTTKESAPEGIIVKRMPSKTLTWLNSPSLIAWAYEKELKNKKIMSNRMKVLYSKIHIILYAPIY
jgi:hypothetical protein